MADQVSDTDFILAGERQIPKSAVAGLSMQFTNTNAKSRKWAATASDTSPDQYGDQATLELFSNFITRAEVSGNKGYLSVAHHFDYPVPVELQSRYGSKVSAGEPEQLFIADDKFRAIGYFAENQLGFETMKTVRADHAKKLPPDERSRISLGFIDLKHQHIADGSIFTRKALSDVCQTCAEGKSGGRRFLDGELIHLAVTRVPVNPRTPIEVIEMKSHIKTRQEDAASIVGEELAEELEQMSATVTELQSLVVRSESDVTDAPVLGEDDIPPAQEENITFSRTELVGLVTSTVSQMLEPLTEAMGLVAQSQAQTVPAATPSNDPRDALHLKVIQAKSRAELDIAFQEYRLAAEQVFTPTDPAEIVAATITKSVTDALAPFKQQLADLKSQIAQNAMNNGQPRPLLVPAGTVPNVQNPAAQDVMRSLMAQAAQSQNTLLNNQVNGQNPVLHSQANPNTNAQTNGVPAGAGAGGVSSITKWAVDSSNVGPPPVSYGR